MTDNMLVRKLTTTARGRDVYLVILGDPPTAVPRPPVPPVMTIVRVTIFSLLWLTPARLAW